MDANPIDPATGPAPEDEATPAAVRPADAGTDESIAERLARNPESKDARLDRALDESMDASDPPATTQPVHSHGGEELPESSGYDPKKEARLAAGPAGARRPIGRILARILAKLGIG